MGPAELRRRLLQFLFAAISRFAGKAYHAPTLRSALGCQSPVGFEETFGRTRRKASERLTASSLNWRVSEEGRT